MKHATIPIFIPHLACPNDCVFCNQKRIAGTEKPIEDLFEYLGDALMKLPDGFTEVDIAFFGGSFTGIETVKMKKYLMVAKLFKTEDPRITGIRISTRPDYISEDILKTLLRYGVTAVELGVQSMDDDVLLLSKRRHNSEQTVKAVKLLKKYPFELILQIMPGLPGDTEQKIIKTTEKVIELKPDGVRIYPCVVIKDTELEDMYYRGEYKPLSLETAVKTAAKMTLLFREHNIKILRTGLHSSDLVQSNSVVAGPFHPAFGEMVSQYIYLIEAENKISEFMAEQKDFDKIYINVSAGSTSKMIGQKRKNIIYLEDKFKLSIKVFEDPTLLPDEIEIKKYVNNMI